MKIRDRIKELRRVPAGDLRSNPRNWRTHSSAQRDALQGVLAEVGYADALLARELSDGSLMLIDGHLRAEVTPQAEVPVLVLDVDEVEADKILATLDPLASMAEAAEIGKPKITPAQLRKGTILRNKCRDDLEMFNVKVFPNSTGLKPFGQVQIDSVEQDRSVIRDGGKICKAEPRAYGKTSRTCNAALWGALYGYRRMIPVFSANMEKSKNQIMARWKAELLGNDLLFWMFPELIWAFRKLGNKPQGAASQVRWSTIPLSRHCGPIERPSCSPATHFGSDSARPAKYSAPTASPPSQFNTAGTCLSATPWPAAARWPKSATPPDTRT